MANWVAAEKDEVMAELEVEDWVEEDEEDMMPNVEMWQQRELASFWDFLEIVCLCYQVSSTMTFMGQVVSQPKTC